jgi:general stress protein YciG
MDAKTRAVFREAMREIGRKGGKIGGKRSRETMTPEERIARAKKASLAAAKKRTAMRLATEDPNPTTRRE